MSHKTKDNRPIDRIKATTIRTYSIIIVLMSIAGIGFIFGLVAALIAIQVAVFSYIVGFTIATITWLDDGRLQ